MKGTVQMKLTCPYCDLSISSEYPVIITNYQPSGGSSRATMVTVKGRTEHHDCPGPGEFQVVSE